VTHHIHGDLYNRRHPEDGDSDADDSDSGPCAAEQCDQEKNGKHD
jgi:hypothetical protein